MGAGAQASREDLAMINAYARARVAGSIGEADRAAQSYAAILALSPDNEMLAARALSEAIQAGDRQLALRAARILEKTNLLTPDARLLFFSEALRTRNWKAASAQIEAIGKDRTFAFMTPILRAWLAFDSGSGDPMELLAGARSDALATAYAAEHRPLMLLALGRRAEGVAELGRIVRGTGGRDSRLRIAAASLLARKGGRKEALELLQGADEPLAAARGLVERGQAIPGGVASGSAGVGEFLVRVAIDLQRQNVVPLALTYARLATFFAPENSETWLVASDLLAAEGQRRQALAVLANVRSHDPFAANAGDSRIKLLVASDRKEEALAEAEAAAKRPGPSIADWTRLGDLYGELKRPRDAAGAYGEALALAKGRGDQSEWALWLLRGGALEQADDWPEARAALEAAYKLAPRQPVVLNYLGYAQLERRENLRFAMGLIAEANKLQPDSAEITDSLGWAHYLHGDFAKAIELLEKAVEGEPADTAINEHLGDAYYSAGRRYEARYAWEAALVAAETEDATRIRAKIEAGLTPKLAAP